MWVVVATACGGSAAPTAMLDAAHASSAKRRDAAYQCELQPARLSRAEVDAVLARGPGALLQQVELAVVLQQRRFAGYRIVAFRQHPDAWQQHGLKPGDVIRRVNGLSVAKPEAIYRLWQQLAVASEVVVELVRAGRPQRLRWAIVERVDAASEQPPAAAHGAKAARKHAGRRD